MSDQPASNNRTGRSVEAFTKALTNNLYYTRGQAVHGATHNDIYMALSYTIRDHLIERWRKTTDAYFETNPKFTFCLTAEQVFAIKETGYNPMDYYLSNPALKAVIEGVSYKRK
jgi:glucan phosphorylase